MNKGVKIFLGAILVVGAGWFGYKTYKNMQKANDTGGASGGDTGDVASAGKKSLKEIVSSVKDGVNQAKDLLKRDPAKKAEAQKERADKASKKAAEKAAKKNKKSHFDNMSEMSNAIGNDLEN